MDSPSDAPAVEIPPVDPETQVDEDSTYDEETLRSSTTSLTDSIYDYRKLHGRTYQVSRTTEYWAPNDDQQNDALDIGHHWMTLLIGDKLHLAPIGDNPRHILDIGTGTGVWAIDMADLYPSSTVTGTDISPIQPPWVPPNCTFLIDDAQLPWTFPPRHFDFIHTRTLEACISDWSALYKRAYHHLLPSGWYEDVAFDILTRSDSPLVDADHIYHKWGPLFFEAGQKMGKTFRHASEPGVLKRDMEAAGFKNVVERMWRAPIGGWSSDPVYKTVGQYNGMFIDQSLEGFALFAFKEILGWEYEEILVFVAQMRRQLRNQKTTPYIRLYVCYGQKPEDATD